MTLEQTQLVGLTMKLELKTMEYQQLCEEIEEIKKTNTNPNDASLQSLLDRLLKNQEEILDINKQLTALKESAEE